MLFVVPVLGVVLMNLRFAACSAFRLLNRNPDLSLPPLILTAVRPHGPRIEFCVSRGPDRHRESIELSVAAALAVFAVLTCRRLSFDRTGAPRFLGLHR